MIIFIPIDLSKNFEVLFGDTTQPVMNAGFQRGETGQIRVLDDSIIGDHAHGPAGKAPGDGAVIVDPLGDEFRFAAENPVSSFPVDDSEPLVEPSLAGKNVDELLQDLYRPSIVRILKGPVFRLHVVPISALHQRAKLSRLYLARQSSLDAFSSLPFHY